MPPYTTANIISSAAKRAMARQEHEVLLLALLREMERKKKTDTGDVWIAHE